MPRSFLHAQGIHSPSCWEGWWLDPSLSISLSWRELFDIISYLFPRGNPHPITSCYELIKFCLPCLKENNCEATSQEFQSFLVIWLKPVLQLICTVTLPFAKTHICHPQWLLFLVCLLYHFWTKISISESVSWKIQTKRVDVRRLSGLRKGILEPAVGQWRCHHKWKWSNNCS